MKKVKAGLQVIKTQVENKHKNNKGKVQRRQGQNVDTLTPIIVLSMAASQKVCVSL